MLTESSVVGQRTQFAQALQIQAPVLADLAVQQTGEIRVGLPQPTAWRNPISLVVEAIRVEFGESRKNGFDHQIGVQFGHAVDAMATDDGQMRHAYALAFFVAVAFVDQRYAAKQVDIAREALFHLGQEVLVDTIDDAHMARQERLDQSDRPGFQRFRHQGVVGIGEDPLTLRPGRCPEHAMLVTEQAHQLGDSDGRVCVVEVDGDLVGQIVEMVVLFQVVEDDVLQGGGDEEVLLPQAEFATGRRTIIRIEDPGNVLKTVLEFGGACVVAEIEGVEVDVSRCGRFPQA